ncbi:MAG: O-antigen ligase family protein [Solirubrobacteraceae bacterium]
MSAAAALGPGVLTVAVGLVLATSDGGFNGERWYPAALFLLALLAITLVSTPSDSGERSRALGRTLMALAAFGVWALASALWSDAPGAAWEGANRVALYGIVLALMARRRWTPREFAVILGLVGAGIGALAVGVLLDSALSADRTTMFIGGRLSEPAGYANATAGLWLIGLFPALGLACHRGLAWPVRSASLGVACMLLEMSLLSVSRGAVASVAATALMLILLSDSRWKTMLAVVTVGGAATLAARPLLAVSGADGVTELESALSAVYVPIAWTSGLVACLAAAAIVLGRRIGRRMVPEVRVVWRVWAERLTGLIALLAVGLALLSIGNPATWASERWTDFKTSGYTEVSSGSGRLTSSLGSGRYDFYRIALNEFREHPTIGIGYESFQTAYLVHRRTDESPRYTHSLAFGILSQLGLIGVVLFVAFLAQALAMSRRALAGAREQRDLVAAALAGFVVWFGHGLVDWLWQFSALGILAFALLGMAMRGCRESAAHASEPAGTRAPKPRRASRHRAWARGWQVAGVIAAVGVAASFATLGIAARLTQAGFQAAPRDTALALDRLELASRLDFLSAAPLLTRGVIARRLGDRRLAETSFEGALSREPRNWFANLELGLIEASAGRREPAIALLTHAEALNPRQQLIDRALNRVRRGQVVSPFDIEQALAEDVSRRVKSVP